jgi:hypothetical protein
VTNEFEEEEADEIFLQRARMWAVSAEIAFVYLVDSRKEK